MNPLIKERATLDANGAITGYAPLEDNPITDTDSYKASHPYQFPKDMQSMYCYFESRGGRYSHAMLVGMQALALQHFVKQVTMNHIQEAAELFAEHGEPFYREGWEHIVTNYDGRLPIRIRAVPEGLAVPVSNALFDVELTSPDSKIAWLPGWVETKLVRLWYPTTVASRGFYIKRHVLEALTKSSDDPLGEIAYKLHCFGGRGGSSLETIRTGGFAHLVNWQGTDTVEALRFARHYYGAKMAGISIPAAEHSTVTSWGREQEGAFYENFVRQFLLGECGQKFPLAACVSDAWDFYNAVENYWCGDHLYSMVRGSGGKLVIRPDSGKPAEVDRKALEIIDRKLGMRRNTKDYKVMPACLGLIQGDGVNDESIPEILHELLSHGYSASNINFGMGGGGLQDLTRDTQRFAYKCAAALRDGKWVDVYKEPATDLGKRSKRGHQALIHEGGRFQTVQGPRKDDYLVPIVENGRMLKLYTLDDVRANAMKGLV